MHGFGFADTFLHCSKFLPPPFFCHSDEYRIKPVEEVKYMKNGAEEEQKIAARNQENLVRTEVLCYQWLVVTIGRKPASHIELKLTPWDKIS